MSAGWEIGDLAVCVDDSPCECCGDDMGVRRGLIYHVVALELEDNLLFLQLAELPPTSTGNHPDGSWVDAPSFRKIRPDEQEPCEAEFITLLKRSKVSA